MCSSAIEKTSLNNQKSIDLNLPSLQFAWDSICLHSWGSGFVSRRSSGYPDWELSCSSL